MEKEQYSADIVVRFLEGESFSKRDFVALLGQERIRRLVSYCRKRH